jgi:hypothetical protein
MKKKRARPTRTDRARPLATLDAQALTEVVGGSAANPADPGAPPYEPLQHNETIVRDDSRPRARRRRRAVVRWPR